MSSVSPGRRAALVFLLAMVLLVPGIGLHYWGRDEATYAGVAHAMNVSGDYLVPRFEGRLFADKPPVAYWLTALAFRILGEREAAGRLPHVLLGAGGAVLVLLLGEHLLDVARGTVASVLFASSLLFVVYARLLLTDSALLFFTLLSILGFVRVLEGDGRWEIAAGAGAALGLAVLSKGPVALLSPGLFCLGYVAGGAAGRSGKTLLRLSLALAVSLAVAAPWFWLAAQATGGAVTRAFWLRENVSRFVAPMEGHGAPAPAVLLVTWLGLFPWSGAFLVVSRRGFLTRCPRQWGLLAWAGGVLLFFALARTKLAHYLLPALPPIALLLAGSLPTPGKLRAATWASALTGAALFLAGVGAVRFAGEVRAAHVLIPLSAACLLSLSLPLVRSDRRQILGVALLASAAIAWGAGPAIDPLRSTGRLGLAARVARRDGEPVGGLRVHEPALTYYSAAPVQSWKSAAEVGRAAAESATSSLLVWLDSAETPSLVRSCRCRVRILDRGPNLADPRVRGELALVRIAQRGRSAE
jgi:4-amino-4-deoxy-L-arabinose transferase-like glycosyltransferase